MPSTNEIKLTKPSVGVVNWPLPDMPIGVLSSHIRGEPWGISAHEVDSFWMALQEDLANLVLNSTRTVSEYGSHNLHIDEPGLVIDAIRQVVKAARHRA